MGLSNENDANLEEKLNLLCSKLGLDSRVNSDAWERFRHINKNFTLEGEPTHWLGCAIYVSCWKATNESQSNVQTNCVNLTGLLRHCNLSIAQFFFKIRQWSDMCKIPEDFRKRIDYLEGSFAVAYNVFKEFEPLFLRIFNVPELTDADLSKQHRNRKQKVILSTPMKVFEFCWSLFIVLKCEDINYSNDLVTSCHLLIAICDWVFKSAFLSNRRDLLNPNFKGLPSNWSDPNFSTPEEAPCIVDLLSPSANINTDVKYIKEYQFKKSIQRLFEQGTLRGKDTNNNDILDASIFEHNFKNISTYYERNFLTRSDFDERIFLAEYRRKTLMKEQAQNNSQDASAEGVSSQETSKEMVVNQGCLTPLTGRKYLGPKEIPESTPFATATESISRLNSLLHGREPGLSEALVQLFQSCSRNPTNRITSIVAKLGDKFVSAYQPDKPDIAKRRLQIAITLFYKFTENILLKERTIQSDISTIVEKDVFFECMFACCLQIIIYSYSSPALYKFPWILETLQIQSYNFVKVIELIIRSKDKLSRDTIKHLNMIEELILSSLLWKSDSLIWEAIAATEKEVPKFEETALPTHIQNEANSENSTLRSILNSEPKQVLSPGPSATDIFQSPIGQNNPNRELFPSIQANQALLQHPHIVIKDSTGNARVIPIVTNENQKSASPVNSSKRPETTSGRPKRTGGVSIVFRKFYNLSGERMEHLCTHLKIMNTETKRKIWTVFEELVRKNNCELMKDRHLDQLLMCAVYMICKLTNLNKSFTEIIKSYRFQPQATGDIYRRVLIGKKVTDGVETDDEDRDDLIKFYNNVIIKAVNIFVQRFVNKGDGEHNGEVPLSPLPLPRGQVVQVLDNIFVKPLESPTMPLSTGKVLNYYFSRSPSKDLKDINKAIKGNGVTGKRLLVEGENEPAAKRYATKKFQSLIEERRNQNNE